MSEATDRSARTNGSASIYDVAHLAGVSHQTVSRVINRHASIRDSTRERVLSAMAELDYAPSSIARALATSRSRRIGVIVDSPVQFGPSATMRGLEHAARSAGYTVSSITIDDAPGDETGLGSTTIRDGYQHLRAQGIDALCVIAPRYSTLAGLRDIQSGQPTLVIKAEPEDDLLTVAVDQYAGAVHVVDHLVELGHRRILHVAGPLDWADARIRQRAYADRMTALHLDVPAPLGGDWTSNDGYRLGSDPEALGDATAIFAANDQMALGLVHALHARALRVPEDVSVIGFDDMPDSGHFLPPLTTVRQDFHALGTLSVTALLAALEGREHTDSVMIDPELIVRESTAPPRP